MFPPPPQDKAKHLNQCDYKKVLQKCTESQAGLHCYWMDTIKLWANNSHRIAGLSDIYSVHKTQTIGGPHKPRSPQSSWTGHNRGSVSPATDHTRSLPKATHNPSQFLYVCVVWRKGATGWTRKTETPYQGCGPWRATGRQAATTWTYHTIINNMNPGTSCLNGLLGHLQQKCDLVVMC